MNDVCAIWGTPAKQRPVLGDYEAYDSPKAGGLYRISRSLLAYDRWDSRSDEVCKKLTAWIYEQHSAGQVEPLLTTCVFEQLQAGAP